MVQGKIALQEKVFERFREPIATLTRDFMLMFKGL